MARRIAPVGVLVACAIASGGCGALPTPEIGADPDRPYRLPARPAPITERVLARYPAGSPPQEVLRWYGAMQGRSFGTAAGLYDPSLGITPRLLRLQRNKARGMFNGSEIARVLDTTRLGNHAIVYTLMEHRLVAPNGRADVYVDPQAFDLVRTRDGWRLADNLLLDNAAKKARPLPFA